MIHELKPKSSRIRTTAQKLAATESRSFRTFLLMRQFAAKEIGQRIAQARRMSGGMTQRDLADALGVGLRSVQDYEAGSTIPWKHFQQLAVIFGTPIEWFLYGDETDDDGVELGSSAEQSRWDGLGRRLDAVEEMLRVISSGVRDVQRRLE